MFTPNNEDQPVCVMIIRYVMTRATPTGGNDSLIYCTATRTPEAEA